eukprot:Gb_32085 [translate_table: standard]
MRVEIIDIPSGREIDPAFQIPVIDLSPLEANPPDEKSVERLVLEVGKACKEWGYFQVVNHGLPIHLLHRLQSAAAELFSLPLYEKRKVRRDEQNPLGYYDTELTKDVAKRWRMAIMVMAVMGMSGVLNGDPTCNVLGDMKCNLASSTIVEAHRYCGLDICTAQCSSTVFPVRALHVFALNTTSISP